MIQKWINEADNAQDNTHNENSRHKNTVDSQISMLTNQVSRLSEANLKLKSQNEMFTNQVSSMLVPKDQSQQKNKHDAIKEEKKIIDHAIFFAPAPSIPSDNTLENLDLPLPMDQNTKFLYSPLMGERDVKE